MESLNADEGLFPISMHLGHATNGLKSNHLSNQINEFLKLTKTRHYHAVCKRTSLLDSYIVKSQTPGLLTWTKAQSLQTSSIIYIFSNLKTPFQNVLFFVDKLSECRPRLYESESRISLISNARLIEDKIRGIQCKDVK